MTGDDMLIRPFVPLDVERLALQPSQAHLRPLLCETRYCDLLARGEAWTAEEGGKVMGCAGILPLREGLGNAWAILGDGFGHSFIVVHRVVQRVLAASTLQRIEAYVDCDFARGHDWMLMLDFQLEAPRMRKFAPGGRDAALYARVR